MVGSFTSYSLELCKTFSIRAISLRYRTPINSRLRICCSKPWEGLSVTPDSRMKFSRNELYFVNSDIYFWMSSRIIELSMKFYFHHSFYRLGNKFYIIVFRKAKFGLIYKNCTIALNFWKITFWLKF